MATAGEETTTLLAEDSGRPRRRKWAAVISTSVVLVALVGAVALLESKKRSSAGNASLRSSIGLSDRWYCKHFEGTDLDMAWCASGPTDEHYEYKASSAPGFAGCGGCGCCLRPLDPLAPPPPVFVVAPAAVFTTKVASTWPVSSEAATTPTTRASTWPVSTDAATTPSSTTPSPTTPSPTTPGTTTQSTTEHAMTQAKYSATRFPWQCDYFKNDTNQNTISCVDGPNPLNGNLGCRVLTESGYEGCGGCGCCDLPFKGVSSGESGILINKPAAFSTPPTNPWVCHLFGPGEDEAWCKEKHQEGGVRYAPAADVGGCQGCGCCLQVIGGSTPYEPPATRPLVMVSPLAPHEMLWECAKEEDFPAGFRLDLCQAEPLRVGNFEYAAPGANIPAFGGCGCACCRRVAGPHVAINQSTYKEFPENYVIYLPEVGSDVERMHKFYMDAYMYLPGYEARVREWEGVDCRQWPWGGRLDVVDKLMPTLERDPKTTEDVPNWWRAPSNWQVNFARTTPDGHSLSGFPHHCGCGMSHLTVWLDARKRGVHPILVSESDGGVSRFQWAGSGYAEDFSAVAIELAKTESTHWDLIIFDKCRMGWTGYGGFHINVPGLRGKYFAYHFGGYNVAGAAMYMVSKSYLDKLDDMLIETSYNMIDAWRDGKCQDGTLRCFTVCAFCEPEPVEEEIRVLQDS